MDTLLLLLRNIASYIPSFLANKWVLAVVFSLAVIPFLPEWFPRYQVTLLEHEQETGNNVLGY